MEELAAQIAEAMRSNTPFLVIDIQHSDWVVGRLLGLSPTGRPVLLYERVELDSRHGAGSPVYSGLLQRLELGRDRQVAMRDTSPLSVRSDTPIRAADMPQIERVTATG